MNKEITKINGNSRFTAFQYNKDGTYLLVFYNNKEDIGNLEKSVGILEFESFGSFSQCLALQVHLHSEISKTLNERAKSKGH